MPTRSAKVLVLFGLILALCPATLAQRNSTDDEFGPVVRAYLGYLRNEQEVVDDRVSRREISGTYYRRNSNRIKALRQMAVKLARDTNNDYLPELEAVSATELTLLFERPPQPASLRVGELVHNTFRFLGSVKTGEIFYVFARLDPYEQADLKERNPEASVIMPSSVPAAGAKSQSRARRINPFP